MHFSKMCVLISLSADKSGPKISFSSIDIWCGEQCYVTIVYYPVKWLARLHQNCVTSGGQLLPWSGL